jgi:hypothetical protein
MRQEENDDTISISFSKNAVNSKDVNTVISISFSNKDHKKGGKSEIVITR